MGCRTFQGRDNVTTIRIITDRLPQPDRHKGAILDVTAEKAASMVAQGFAEIIAAAPVGEPPAASTLKDEIHAAIKVISPPAPRRRRAEGAAL